MKNTEQTINQEISRRIKILRKEKKITQQQLADCTGITIKSIQNYENAVREPNSKAMAALESFFQVSGSYLRGETNERVIREAKQMKKNEQTINHEISKRIKLLRKEKGLTQAELAKKIGLGTPTIIGYENCKREPNSKAMAALESFFKVSGSYLRGETDERQYDSENVLTSKKTLDNEELDLLYNLVFKEIMWAERLAENFDLNSKENVDTKASLVKLAAKLMCMKN